MSGFSDAILTSLTSNILVQLLLGAGIYIVIYIVASMLIHLPFVPWILAIVGMIFLQRYIVKTAVEELSYRGYSIGSQRPW
jgi:hypothetical protein